MSWLLLTCAVMGIGVAGLWTNARRAQGCHDEREHYRLSVRFWTILAAMGFVVSVLMVAPLASWGLFESLAAQTAAALTMIPPSILIGAGAINAITLGRTMRRRDLALAAAGRAEGVVVDRHRRALSQDLMAVEFVVELPVEDPPGQAPYRPIDPAPTRRVRLSELCPADNWERLAPGEKIEIAYDPQDPARYALLLFEGSVGPRALAAGASPQLALEGPAEGLDDE